MTTLFSNSQTLQESPQVIFVLRISDGSFATGFSAILEVIEPGRVNEQQKYQFPAFAQIPEAYQQWKTSYSDLSNASGAPVGNTRAIQPVIGQITQRSYAERQSRCKQATDAFEKICTAWFKQPNFEALRRSILSAVQLRQLQQIPVLLEANTSSSDENTLLQKLPWHVWELFDQDLRRSEMILNAPVAANNHQLSAPVKILAIFGTHSGGLQLNGDLATLQTHLGDKGALLTLLDQPSPRELQESLRQKSWDILFFAGHSNSCAEVSGGVIHLQEGVVLSLRDLRASLNQAVENGLKLAIFNSCDGLDLASYLAERKVPISIVMREPVPDRVARYFLKYFLEEFSQGQLNLQAAVRVAREQLQWLEADGLQACPAATWLPIICQNPNQSPLFWPALLPKTATAPPAILPAPVIPIAPGTGIQPPSTVNTQTTKPGSPPMPQPHNQATQSRQKGTSMAWKKGAGALLILLLLVGGRVAYEIMKPDNPDAINTAIPLAERFSEGDRELVIDESKYIISGCPNDTKQDFEQAKDSGIRAINQKNYAAAEKALSYAWSLCPAPEALIYRNNARIGDAPALTVAVSVATTNKGEKEDITKNAIEQLRGAAQAQSVINERGGINGKLLRLVITNDSNEPEVATEIAKALTDNSHRDVLAIVGHWTSGVTIEAAKIYNAKEDLVLMTPISIINDLTGTSSWVFRATINMSKEQSALANYAYNSLNYKKVAIFYLDSQTPGVGRSKAAYSAGAKSAFEMTFRGEVLEDEFNLASDEFERKGLEATAKAMVKQAKKKGADAILLLPDNTLVANAEAVIQAASQEGISLLGTTNFYRQDVLKKNCPAIAGMTLPVAWQADGRANASFVKTAKEFWQGGVNFATANTYNAIQAIAKAMEDNPTREGIHTALNQPDFKVEDTADAEAMTFSDGDRTAPAQIVRVVEETGRNSNEPECKFVPIE